MSRRRFLGTAALAAAALAESRPVPARAATRPMAPTGSAGYSMAMHIHSSFSEFGGSMDAHAQQAMLHGVDMIWWSEHDHRMAAMDYRDTVHFTSLAEEGAPGQGGVWTWVPVTTGSPASYGGGIVQTPCSPNDPVAGGSLSLAAQAAGTGPAGYGYGADAASYNFRDNLTGQTISIDVLLNPGWVNGYLEVAIGTSYHPATPTQAGGFYSLSYRLVPAGTLVPPPTATGIQGAVYIPVDNTNGWVTVSLTPASDIAVLWPDMDSRDFAFYTLALNAVSTGDPVSGYLDYLQFSRAVTGEACLEQQQAMMTTLAAVYPGVLQQQALEVSWQSPHINWYGQTGVSEPTYAPMTAQAWPGYLAGTVIPQIHQGGGLCSYNHPFGFSRVALKPASTQDAGLAKVATSLLGSASLPAMLGTDLLEVGYPSRAGYDLAHHVGLWDVMSRNGIFLTGTGTSDDHVGMNWTSGPDCWITSAWSASSQPGDLLAALAAGQSWCGSLREFGPGASLDLSADGGCPMGSVSVSSAPTRTVTVSVARVPKGGSLQLVQGTVDNAGAAQPTPNTSVVASWPRYQVAKAGSIISQAVAATEPVFARAQVVDWKGAVIALSNPVWLMQAEPPGGIPPARQA